MAKRLKWMDDNFETTLIDDYARKLTSFLDAMADGHVDSQELTSQESRLVSLMKEVEPLLNDEQHAKVTQLASVRPEPCPGPSPTAKLCAGIEGRGLAPADRHQVLGWHGRGGPRGVVQEILGLGKK
jgi:hypothetical protein